MNSSTNADRSKRDHNGCAGIGGATAPDQQPTGQTVQSAAAQQQRSRGQRGNGYCGAASGHYAQRQGANAAGSGAAQANRGLRRRPTDDDQGQRASPMPVRRRLACRPREPQNCLEGEVNRSADEEAPVDLADGDGDHVKNAEPSEASGIVRATCDTDARGPNEDGGALTRAALLRRLRAAPATPSPTAMETADARRARGSVYGAAATDTTAASEPRRVGQARSVYSAAADVLPAACIGQRIAAASSGPYPVLQSVPAVVGGRGQHEAAAHAAADEHCRRRLRGKQKPQQPASGETKDDTLAVTAATRPANSSRRNGDPT